MMQKTLKIYWNPGWHTGTHLQVPGESYQMNTNMTQFRWFQKSLHLCALEGLTKYYWKILNEGFSGLEIRGCREPRAPLNSPAAPSNFCRELPQIFAGIPNMYWFLYTSPLGSIWRCDSAPSNKALFQALVLQKALVGDFCYSTTFIREAPQKGKLLWWNL